MSNEQQNQAMPESSQQPQVPPMAGESRVGDDVLNLLDQIGGHLEALRRIKAERDAHALEAAAREAELAARQREIDEAAAAVARRAEEAHALERQIEFSRAETTTESQRLSHLAQQLESRTRELDEKFQRADQRIGELDQRERELGERLRKFEQAAEELRAQSSELAQREAELSESGRREADEIAGLRAKLQEAEAGRAQLAQQFETLNAELASARQELASAGAALNEAGQRAANLERELAAARENSVPADQVAKYEKAIATLRERLESSEKRGKSLSSELEDTKNKINESADVEQLAWNALRRERLRVYKALLQQQARKLNQAKKMLAKKHEELSRGGGSTSGGVTSAKLEQENARLVEARRQLASERAEITTMRQAVEMKLAKKTSMIGVACASVTLVAILIGSWFAAGKFVKPVYLASATIGIDMREVEEGSEQLTNWMAFQKQLVTDPQVLDQAAQRFDARGFKELSTPSDVRAYLGERLEVAEAAQGQVTLTISGEGSERTARVLETLVTALVSYANDTRDLRADQASTIVVAGARASGEPVEDPRIALAGAIAGGASALALFLGVMMWRNVTQEVKGTPEPAYAMEEQAMQPVESPAEGTIGTSGVAKSIASRRPI